MNLNMTNWVINNIVITGSPEDIQIIMNTPYIAMLKTIYYV